MGMTEWAQLKCDSLHRLSMWTGSKYYADLPAGGGQATTSSRSRTSRTPLLEVHRYLQLAMPVAFWPDYPVTYARR